MYRTPREVTTKILELCEMRLLDPYSVLLMALNYMSEDEVAKMAHYEGLFETEDDEHLDPNS